jgi:hypothetical protein
MKNFLNKLISYGSGRDIFRRSDIVKLLRGLIDYVSSVRVISVTYSELSFFSSNVFNGDAITNIQVEGNTIITEWNEGRT